MTAELVNDTHISEHLHQGDPENEELRLDSLTRELREIHQRIKNLLNRQDEAL